MTLFLYLFSIISLAYLQRGATTQIVGKGNVKVVASNEAVKAKTPPTPPAAVPVPWYAFWRSKAATPPKDATKTTGEEEEQPLLSKEPEVDEEGKTDVSCSSRVVVLLK